MKADRMIIKETGYIALMVLVLSGLMQSVFLAAGRWDLTVLLGNLLGGVGATLNFFLMGLTVQEVLRDEPENAAKRIKASQVMRMLMLAVFAATGAALPGFNTVAALLPLLFPRIAIGVQGIFVKEEKTGQVE